MKDFIFIIGPSAVGKTTLAKELYQHYHGVYIEQSMVPEFVIPEGVKDVGIYEEDLCFKNTLMQMKWFYKKGYRNIIALDFDDLRVRSFPKLFKGYNYIILRLISSNYQQIKNQMEERHKTGQGLYIPDGDSKSNEVIKNRPLLPNEVVIDVNGKNTINTKYRNQLYYQFEIYVKSSKDMFIYVDSSTSLLPDGNSNRQVARNSGDVTTDELNKTVESLRVSYYTEDNYFIYEPYPDYVNGERVREPYFGKLDAVPHDGYYDIDLDYNEILYGAYENADKIVYDESGRNKK